MNDVTLENLPRVLDALPAFYSRYYERPKKEGIVIELHPLTRLPVSITPAQGHSFFDEQRVHTMHLACRGGFWGTSYGCSPNPRASAKSLNRFCRSKLKIYFVYHSKEDVVLANLVEEPDHGPGFSPNDKHREHYACKQTLHVALEAGPEKLATFRSRNIIFKAIRTNKKRGAPEIVMKQLVKRRRHFSNISGYLKRHADRRHQRDSD